MSTKKYFEKQKENALKLKGLSIKSKSNFIVDAESSKYVEEFLKEKGSFYPDLDYSEPANFVKYGSAKTYYDNAFKRIRTQYPYDGSFAEKLEFYNSLTPFEQYIYNKKYPKLTGFVEFTSGDWDPGGDADEFGSTLVPQYVRFYGGPHEKNIIDSDTNQENNLEFSYSQGNSIEFWMKKDGFVAGAATDYEGIFNLRNSIDTQRFWIFLSSGDDISKLYVTHVNWTGGAMEVINDVGLNTKLSTIADSKWHHYAVVSDLSGTVARSKLYVDGACSDTQYYTPASTVYAITGALIGTIGAGGGRKEQGGAPDTTKITTEAGYGKLSGSLDDFRFWKTVRNPKQIGLNYFRPIAGGTNTDTTKYYYSSSIDNNVVDLGVYFKFNEGIVGVSIPDKTILDYSGRSSDGVYFGYSGSCRATASAMVLSGVAEKEAGEPVLYSAHPQYSASLEPLQASGSNYDFNNNSYLYNILPDWIISEDQDYGTEIQTLLQIFGSYFDTAHAQISEITRLKENRYSNFDNKQNDFNSKLLNSVGFDVPEMFIDSDVLKTIFDQDDKRVFENKLYELKNKIYKNIYNNLIYIYKSKGTENAFRNVFRCFGTDDEIFKINLYGDNVEYEIKDNPYSTYIKKNLIDFSGISTASVDNREAVIYQYYDNNRENEDIYGYYPSSSNPNIPLTVEAEFILPKIPKIPEVAALSVLTSASLFGVHSSSLAHATTSIPTIGSPNSFQDAGFQAYSVKKAQGAYFLLTSSNGFLPSLSSSVFTDDNSKLYDNLKWNLAVRIKPERYPFSDEVVFSSSSLYEFYGTKVHLGETLAEFYVSASITYASASQFLTGSNKRFYIGAKRENITGALEIKSDARFSRFMVWEDYVSNSEIRHHARDPRNFGRKYPHDNTFIFEGPVAVNYIPKADTLALNWEFDGVTTASNAGIVQHILDSTSGSTTGTIPGQISQKYYKNNYSNVVDRNFAARGSAFAPSQKARVLGFLPTRRIQAPDSLYSADLVQVLDQDDAEFIKFRQPVKHYFAVEASMYEVISRNLLHYFDSVIAFNNLIGEPVNRYRSSYKDLRFLRSLLFDKIHDVALLDKFVSLYKFLDNALDSVLSNLIPASAASAEQVRTIVEDHVLDRQKYRHKVNFFFQELDAQGVNVSKNATPVAQAQLQDPTKPLATDNGYNSTIVNTESMRTPWTDNAGSNRYEVPGFAHEEQSRGGTGISNPARPYGNDTPNKTGRDLAKKKSREDVERTYSDIEQTLTPPPIAAHATVTIIGAATLDDAAGTSLKLVNTDGSIITFTTNATKNFADTVTETASPFTINTRDISGGDEVRKATQAAWISCKQAIDESVLNMSINPTSFAGTEESFTLTQTTAGANGNTTITLITGITADGETTFTGGAGGFDGAFQGIGGTSYNTVGTGSGQCVFGPNVGPVVMPANVTASFVYPTVRLVETPGEDNVSIGPAGTGQTLYGMQILESGSSTNGFSNSLNIDRSIIDGLRAKGTSVSDLVESAFYFTLDDIKSTTTIPAREINSGKTLGTTTLAYVSGSRADSTSYSYVNGIKAVLDNVKGFRVPLFGGFDGWDVQESDPISNTALNGGTTLTDYAYFSVAKAIDMAGDSNRTPGSMVVVPGLREDTLTDRLLQKAARRADLLAVIDLDAGQKMDTEVAAANVDVKGSVSTLITNKKNRRLDTSYGCAFFPDFRGRLTGDAFDAPSAIMLPSSIAGMGVLTYTENVKQLWFAPAGFNRGGLAGALNPAGIGVESVSFDLTQRQCDDLYSTNVNPIKTFNRDYVVFGQKTLQVKRSALDRINVRRLAIFIKDFMRETAKGFLFEQNVPSTWTSFKSLVEPKLQNIKAGLGITDFKLILDETTTTPDLIDRNVMYVKLMVKPARAIEYIVIDFTLTNTGVEF